MKQALGEACLTAVALALLIWSAVTMLLDGFSLAPAAEETKPFLWYLLLGTLPFLAWNGFMTCLGKKKLRLLGNVVLFLFLALQAPFLHSEGDPGKGVT